MDHDSHETYKRRKIEDSKIDSTIQGQRSRMTVMLPYFYDKRWNKG
jgi:hypothetical protein